MNTEIATAPQPIGFIRFRSLTLLAVSHNGQQYVPARPICELIGIDWKTQKNVLEDDYGQEMYGTCWLVSPKINGILELKLPKSCHIRLDRVAFFIARINPKRVQANGNLEAAQWLMALHHEWAEVLHRYETHGIAVKAGRNTALEELLRMTKLRNQLNDPKDRRYVDQLIHEGLHTLGQPDNPLHNNEQQSALPLPISFV